MAFSNHSVSHSPTVTLLGSMNVALFASWMRLLPDRFGHGTAQAATEVGHGARHEARRRAAPGRAHGTNKLRPPSS